MEWHASTVLDTAYEAGVRYFDAARSYGKAEAFLASWLEHRALPPEAVEDPGLPFAELPLGVTHAG